jgi:hypothetical protein
MKLLVSLSCFLFVIFVSGQTTTAKDSAQIKTTITNFYKWYTNNFKKFQAFKLYRGRGGEEAPPYRIDWKETERYFNYLRKDVPYVGESFIASEKEYFRSADSTFRKNPADEIPAGFDYDRFTRSQEDPKWFWRELIKKGVIHWVVKVHGITATAMIYESEGVLSEKRGWWKFFCVEMKKEKGMWKIAKIGCELDEPQL